MVRMSEKATREPGACIGNVKNGCMTMSAVDALRCVSVTEKETFLSFWGVFLVFYQGFENGSLRSFVTVRHPIA